MGYSWIFHKRAGLFPCHSLQQLRTSHSVSSWWSFSIQGSVDGQSSGTADLLTGLVASLVGIWHNDIESVEYIYLELDTIDVEF